MATYCWDLPRSSWSSLFFWGNKTKNIMSFACTWQQVAAVLCHWERQAPWNLDLQGLTWRGPNPNKESKGECCMCLYKQSTDPIVMRHSWGDFWAPLSQSGEFSLGYTRALHRRWWSRECITDCVFLWPCGCRSVTGRNICRYLGCTGVNRESDLGHQMWIFYCGPVVTFHIFYIF